jgi:hypothetical protein
MNIILLPYNVQEKAGLALGVNKGNNIKSDV